MLVIFWVIAVFSLGFLDKNHPDGCEVVSQCSDLHFSKSDIEHLFMCLLAICVFLEKCLFKPQILPTFLKNLFIFGCAGSLCCMGFSPAIESRDYSLVVVHELLTVIVSLVVEHGL